VGPGDLDQAAEALELGRGLVARAAGHLAARGGVEANQALAYDLSHAAAALQAGEAALAGADAGQPWAALAVAFAAEALAALGARLVGRGRALGVDPADLDRTGAFLERWRDPERLAALAELEGPRGLGEDLELMAATFRRFAEERVRPWAQAVHLEDLDVPEEVIAGLAGLGAFGLSIPEPYGGSATGGVGDYLAMLVATEELSRVSLGAGGSLITRPEILARALLRGGTERQKRLWLPSLADGSTMAAVAVTEPDFGSDVAGLRFSATPDGRGGWRLDGTKTWCTFAGRADVLMLLARSDPDRSLGHRGLSLFVVPKPRASGRQFAFDQADGGRLEGRAIATLGYRGMHSYELRFDSWSVAGESLVGEAEGLGRGFYYQMEGFDSGRLQTAARAVGVMQAAWEEACRQSRSRVVFGKALVDHQLTRVKLAKMAATIHAARQQAYQAARLMAGGGGSLEASMSKAFACAAAEWVTREAMQLHGGVGYAKEAVVSRLWLDARVLSIFEGADETLALKVIARRLLEQGSQPPSRRTARSRDRRNQGRNAKG